MKNLEHKHTSNAIRKRLAMPHRANYLRDWIYGGIDGSVTTFAIVAGAIGGELSIGVIIILGIANLVADGFSMAAGNYLGTKSEIDLYDKYKKIEKKHIDLAFEGEKEEIRQIYIRKKFSGKILNDIVETIVNDKNLWVETMLFEEYGITKVLRSPIKAALSTFISFLICGCVPLLPYVFRLPNSFTLACVFTGLTFFSIGSIKSLWSIKSWLYSGVETTLVGLSAASIAYSIGLLLANVK